MKERNRKSIVLLIVTILVLIIVVVGSAFAYLTIQTDGSNKADVIVTVNTTDSLMFSFGDPINIEAEQKNFGKNADNLSSKTTGTATLIANNDTNEATSKYNVYFIIDENNFEYTTEDGKMELYLTVKAPNGDYLESIQGLKSEGEKFDITTRTGGFLIAKDYVIEARGREVHEWEFEVTLVNLETDQQKNTDKKFNGRIMFSKEEYETYQLTEINTVNLSTIDSFNIEGSIDYKKGTENIKQYYYGIVETEKDTGEVNNINFYESTNEKFSFKELKANTNYTLYAYTIDELNFKSNIYTTELTTLKYPYPEITNVSYFEDLHYIDIGPVEYNSETEIEEFYFSIDNGENWIVETNDWYYFEDLIENTNYKILIKIKDTNGYFSPVYELNLKTLELPEIYVNSIEESFHYITFELGVVDPNYLLSYLYVSKDEGKNWIQLDDCDFNSYCYYTESGLEEGQTVNLLVKGEFYDGTFTEIENVSGTSISSQLDHIQATCVGDGLINYTLNTNCPTDHCEVDVCIGTNWEESQCSSLDGELNIRYKIEDGGVGDENVEDIFLSYAGGAHYYLDYTDLDKYYLFLRASDENMNYSSVWKYKLETILPEVTISNCSGFEGKFEGMLDN